MIALISSVSMPHRKSINPRKASPGLVVGAFALVMTACVLAASAFKVMHERDGELQRGRIDIQNLAHSLAENAAHTIQAPDIAMTGMMDLLRYQNPLPERFNKYLADIVAVLPQVREMGVLDADGSWRYRSVAEAPAHNNADRPYFIFHRDNPSRDLRISEPFQSRLTGRLTILLSRRVSKVDGSFGGVLFAAIDCEYFGRFYNTFHLGKDASIALIRKDGVVLMRVPTFEPGMEVSGTDLFKTHLAEGPSGFYRIISPFDGIAKYVGYATAAHYGLIVTVAQPEAEVLAKWRTMLGSDLLITGAQLGVVILLAAMLMQQFKRRLKTEAALREREAYFRLLTENIADVVILIDARGMLRYVSHAVEAMLGHLPEDLTGKPCFDLVHPDDRDSVREATTASGGPEQMSAVFRTFRADGTVVWVEINFRRSSMQVNDAGNGFVGVLRNVTERKQMEDELTKLNGRLSQLATTDGLTGLANRRTFDAFLRREYETAGELTVILFDIDHFKGFNDTYGHQAGDRCLQSVARVIGAATENTRGLSARYGGEEFVLVLPGVSEDGAIKVAESIRLQVRGLGIPNTAAERGIVTISAGLASKTRSTLDEAALVGDADVALYEAKRTGRNRVISRAAMAVAFHVSPSLQPEKGSGAPVMQSSKSS